MKYIPTLSDLPADKPNCGNCSHNGTCARSEESGNHNGYIVNPNTREITGMICGCLRWEGKLATKEG